MKGQNKAFKAISLLLSVLLVFGIFTVSVFAEDDDIVVTEKNLDAKYGDIVPTDKNLKAYKTKYTFYGDSTTLYFMVFSEGKSIANCAVEIYSQSSMSENSLVTSYSNTLGKAGNRSLSINWNFKKIHSGKYYGKSYIYTESDGKKTVDTSTVRTFTVNIDRIGKQTVGLVSAKNTNGGVTVSWNKISIATKYYIYRKLSGDKSWTSLATVKSTSLSYKDTTVKSGKKYVYTVRAADGTFKSLYNKTGLTILYLSQPTLKSINGSGASGVAKITWSKVSGAKGYYVYRKGGSLSNTSWKKVATVSAGTTSYTDKTATSTDWKYIYTVKAYNGNTTSSCNGTGLEFNYLKAPTITSLKLVSSGVTISFKDPNILKNKYTIYRKLSGETSWTKIGTTSSLSYTDTTAKSGKTYSYTVRSTYTTNSGAYSDTGKSTLFLAAPVPTLTKSGDGVMNIKWNEIAGAKGYYVFRKTANSAWTKIATINSGKTVSYTDKSAKTSGTKYTYTVKAFNGSVLSSNYGDKAYSVYIKSPTLKGENTKDGISLKWNTVAGAQGYTLYRKNAENGWTPLVTLTEDTSYVDTEITSGTLYTYKIEAVSGDYKSKETILNIYGVGIPVVTDAVVTEDGVNIIWDNVEGSDTYYIYRKSVDGEWTAIGSYSLNEFTDTSAECLTEDFYYTVSAAIGNDKGVYDETGVKNFTAKPTVIGAFDEHIGEEQQPTNTITWNNDFDIDSYELYRKAHNEEVPVLLGTFTKDDIKTEGEEITYKDNFVYEDTALTQGVEYTYTVKPVKDGKLVYEATTEILEWKFEAVDFVLTRTEGTEETLEAPATAAGLIITWSPAEFAEAYEILRKSENGEFEVIATVPYNEETETYTYLDSTILRDTTYTYTVKGVKDNRNSDCKTVEKSATLYTPAEGVTPVLEIVDGEEEGTKNIVVTWDSVDGNCDAYKLYRKIDDGDWVLADIFLLPAENIFTEENISPETTYSYKIVALLLDRAVNQKDEASILWKNNNIEAVDFELTKTEGTPETQEQEATPAGIIITWTPADYASSYEILRKSGEEEFEVIATVLCDESETYTYLDSTILRDTEYTYTVKGIDEGRKTTYDTEGKSETLYTIST